MAAAWLPNCLVLIDFLQPLDWQHHSGSISQMFEITGTQFLPRYV